MPKFHPSKLAVGLACVAIPLPVGIVYLFRGNGGLAYLFFCIVLIGTFLVWTAPPVGE